MEIIIINIKKKFKTDVIVYDEFSVPSGQAPNYWKIIQHSYLMDYDRALLPVHFYHFSLALGGPW